MAKMVAREPRRTKWGGGCDGGCCNTSRVQRTVKKSVKHQERRETASLPREEGDLYPMFYETWVAAQDDVEYDTSLEGTGVVWRSETPSMA